MTLEVTRKSIGDTLSLLEKYEWQIPKFQRDFIWNRSQVFELLKSIFAGRPIGLITLWAQPQGQPYTAHEPIKLRNVPFGTDKPDPAVIKLVLDGKQRLTTLAIAFGKLRPPDARFQFSEDWFINLDAEPDSDNVIKYEKPSDVIRKKLTTEGVCLAEALIPLHHYKKLNQYNQNINNSAFYPEGKFPSDEIRAKRSIRLGTLSDMIKTYQIPIAELPESVTLQEVCEIFNVLNTTGTKVSTFDLIHNLIYSDTFGSFNLRDCFKKIREEQTSLQHLCDPNRQDYFAQIVTGCYLSRPQEERIRRERSVSTEFINSIKGGDLIDTPTTFYQEIVGDLEKIDGYTADFFNDILGGEFKLKELPYPVSVILYLSLRWKRDKILNDHEKYSIEQLHRVYKAFFWRNVFTTRYDQGFLTLFATDLKKLSDMLIQNKDSQNWVDECNSALNNIFTYENIALTEEEIRLIVTNGDIRGAIRQALTLILLSKVKNDVISKKPLNRLNDDKKTKVELHHIFPAQWCNDNWKHHPILRDNQEIVNSIVNFIPMTAESNKKWLTYSPATAIATFGLNSEANKTIFNQAFISNDLFEILNKTNPDPDEFFDLRAKEISKYIYNLQFIQ
jgi:hypothetical protein